MNPSAQFDILLANGEAAKTARRAVANMLPADDVDDVVQEALLRAWQSVRNFRGDSALSTWIYRIARNVAITWLYAQSVRPPSQDVDLDDAELEAPELMVEDGRLYEALGKLPADQRALLLLQADGLRYDALAEMMGTKEGTIKSRLHRARTMLKELMDDVG